MSKTLVIGTIVVVVGLFALGGFLLRQQAGLGPSSPTQQTSPPSASSLKQEQIPAVRVDEQLEPKVVQAILATGNLAVIFEKEDGSRQEYTLTQWKEDVRRKFGTIKIPISYPPQFIDVDPIYINQITFVSLSPDGKKAFLILKVEVPVQPGGQGGISGLSLEVLDLQNGITPIDARERFDIYLSPVGAFWSPDNKYIAIAMRDKTSRLNPKEDLYLCEAADLRCWKTSNHTFTTNLGISSIVAELDFRDFNWDVSKNKIFFSTNTGNAPPPLGEALWQLDLATRQLGLVVIVVESRDLREKRAERAATQIIGVQRIYQWFRCRERIDFQECNDDIRSLFEKQETLPFELMVSGEELISFFEEKFVRFSGQRFGVVFRGYIADYVDGETIILLYVDDASELPNVGTIFITQNEEGKWFVSETIESLVPGLLADIEQLVENAKEVVSGKE